MRPFCRHGCLSFVSDAFVVKNMGLIDNVTVKLIKTLKIRGFYEGFDSSAVGASGGYFIHVGTFARKRMRMGTE